MSLHQREKECKTYLSSYQFFFFSTSCTNLSAHIRPYMCDWYKMRRKSQKYGEELFTWDIVHTKYPSYLFQHVHAFYPDSLCLIFLNIQNFVYGFNIFTNNTIPSFHFHLIQLKLFYCLAYFKNIMQSFIQISKIFIRNKKHWCYIFHLKTDLLHVNEIDVNKCYQNRLIDNQMIV